MRLPRDSVERLKRILIGFPSNLIDTPHPESSRRAGARLVSHASPKIAWLTDINGSRTRAKIFSAKFERERTGPRRACVTVSHAAARFASFLRKARFLHRALFSLSLSPTEYEYLRRDARLAVVDHTQKPLDENRKRNRDAQKLSRGARAVFPTSLIKCFLWYRLYRVYWVQDLKEYILLLDRRSLLYIL